MMSNEEIANQFIIKAAKKLEVILENTDIADEDFVDTLEELNIDLQYFIDEIQSIKRTAAEIMMLESMFEL